MGTLLTILVVVFMINLAVLAIASVRAFRPSVREEWQLDHRGELHGRS